MRHALPARLRDVRAGPLSGRQIHVDGNDARTFARQPRGDGAAVAMRRAGHAGAENYRNPVVQIGHIFLLDNFVTGRITLLSII